ncbi:acyl carrier protein [Streptomyces dangxiongensis]|uniref:Acyl carrier protein n=1 Tax=Streptomyces dangxiongensis TaxID=1442032 RepID=A0A3G2JDD5_9ACTN|nr:phosphopantetheine-binding protein [Streptomyces dangxiongensis]AYN40340.1 acyl carrier protein [Streptomyces dangxiongensis]
MTEDTSRARRTRVEREIRGMLADATRAERARVERLPSDTKLFGAELSLSSLAGVTLLSAITDRYGVDVAAQDLSLECLESISTLVDFVVRHLPRSPESGV